MKTARLTRRLGLDDNPLRRRADKIAACAAALLVAAFLIGAPLLSAAAVGWASRSAAARLQAERAWHRVPASLLQAVPLPAAAAGGLLVDSQVLARWTAPDGRARIGRIPVRGHLAAGRTVRLWVDRAGSPTAPPLHHHGVAADEAAAAVAAIAALGTALLCLAWAGRWMLNRRRLAAWEAAWAAVGPQWTRRFRSRG